MTDIALEPTCVVVVEEQLLFTLAALCRASGADAEQVQALVSEGLLTPADSTGGEWRFGGGALPQARTALRLARDLELELPAVALVMGLLAENERLRSELRRR